MDHLADSIAKLSQGRENWYIGREGIPVDDSSGENCVPVIVFECLDLSISQRVNMSGLSCVSNKVGYSGAGIATRSYVTLYIIKSLRGVGLRGASLGPST